MDLRALRARAADLGFTPQPQVRWLAPRELLRTAAIVASAAVVSGYWDKREMQAALPQELLTVPADGDGGLWLDFVADTGDGFDPTCTVAHLLAARTLDVDTPDGGTLVLPRAGVLVLGGDQVYPTPSALGYEDRLRGPFRAALPSADPAPLLLVLPGNHDWYDGLTAFLRVFSQGRRVGGWQTVQKRSYFAVRLPHDWWLVGLDSQQDSDIDEPQVAFFREHLSAHLRPGHGVIVCSAVPSWVRAEEVRTGARTQPSTGGTPFDSLHWFEENLVRHTVDASGARVSTGACVRLWLSGDSHHYARYAEAVPADAGPGAARQLVTCGLGGAYTSATHELPMAVCVPPEGTRVRSDARPVRFALAARYPHEDDSRRAARGVVLPGRHALPFRNPGFWRLAGGVHAALFLALAGVLGLSLDVGPAQAVRTASVVDVARIAYQAGIWFLGLVVLTSLVPVVRRRRPRAVHGAFWAAALQLAVGFAGLAAAVAVPWPTEGTVRDWMLLGLCLVGTLLVTGLVASFAFAVSVFLSRRGLPADWTMSAQAREERKGFLRLHLTPQGALVLHPVVVDTVCHDWRVDGTEAEPGDAVARPVPVVLPRPRLVEPATPLDRTT